MVCNELPSGTVGWVVAHGMVGFGSFVVQIRKVLFFLPFSKFLFRLSVRLRFRLRAVMKGYLLEMSAQ